MKLQIREVYHNKVTKNRNKTCLLLRFSQVSQEEEMMERKICSLLVWGIVGREKSKVEVEVGGGVGM